MTGGSYLLAGCGRVGGRLLAAEQAAARALSILSRDPLRRSAELAAGVTAWFEADLDRGAPSDPPPSFSGVWYLVPPPGEGRSDPRLRRFLEWLEPAPPRRLVLVSTTGVYGDCGGAWVDEGRRPDPATDRARRRLDAEGALRQWCDARGVQWVILRVAGIYGPGMLPEGRLRRSEPVLQAAEAPWSNRIHVEDLVQALQAAMHRPEAAGLYNATDGNPTTMTDYFNRVADHLGLPRPPEISRAEARRRLSCGMLSYLSESKRLSNRRLVEQLGVRLRYPTLEKGLPPADDA